MRFKPLAALAAMSLVAGSSVAAAQVAPAAPVAGLERAGAETTDANALYGSTTLLVVGAVVLGLAIWGIIELTSDDDDEPVSP